MALNGRGHASRHPGELVLRQLDLVFLCSLAIKC